MATQWERTRLETVPPSPHPPGLCLPRTTLCVRSGGLRRRAPRPRGSRDKLVPGSGRPVLGSREPTPAFMVCGECLVLKALIQKINNWPPKPVSQAADTARPPSGACLRYIIWLCAGRAGSPASQGPPESRSSRSRASTETVKKAGDTMG